ncbi:PQQ-binding-like beta-propeller repeat protein, partial [bacterium AH-315-C20]|nr:PQQ-binding-like beta-propeller repeat protein [bacterium AH-315-C20]
MAKNKFFQLSILLLLSFWVGSAMIGHQKTTSDLNQFELDDSTIVKLATADSTLTDSSDMFSVLEIVKKLNSDGMPKPTSEFKKGHVNETNVKTTVKKTDNGFEIKLPANNGVPSPSFYNGQLYVSGGFGSKQFFCFDAETGEKTWGVDLDDDGPSSAVIKDGIVVFNTESCTIFACEEESGKQLWSHWLGDPLMSTPTIANNLVFTTYPAYGNWGTVEDYADITEGKFNPTHVLIAFDLRTGAIQWQKWIDGDAIMAPVADGDDLHLTSFTGTYYVVDQKTGEFKSANRMRGTSAPTICKTGILMSKRSDKLHEDDNASESIMFFSLNSGQWAENYKREEADYLDHKIQNSSRLKSSADHDDAGNGFSAGAPASANANKAMMNIGQSNVSSLQAFVGSRTLNYNGRNFNTMGDSLVCTDETSGEAKWKIGIKGDSKTQGGFMGTPPIKVGDCILIATYNGDLVLYTSIDGKEKKRWSTGEHIRSQPIAENGWIYASTTTGKIVAINTKD